MALTNKLRAAVFARDKAICAFSGLSVWIPDYGASGVHHSDWADHIKPASKGGKDAFDNLVCASAFYNSKKMNNSHDTYYLFTNGRPTDYFFWNHPCLSSEQVNVICSHNSITNTDWYFNRALTNIFNAMWNEYVGFKASRTRKYWLTSAQKRLVDWQKNGGKNDFLKRGLIRYPSAPDVKIIFELAKIDFGISNRSGDLAIRRAYEKLKPYYFRNTLAFEDFLSARNNEKRERVLKKAATNKYVTQPMLDSMKHNYKKLKWIDGPTAVFLDK